MLSLSSLNSVRLNSACMPSLGSLRSVVRLECKHTTLACSLTSVGLLALAYKTYKTLKCIRYRRTRSKYFQDKTVFITGASSGIGKAIAEELYHLGAQLILASRNGDELNKIKQSLTQKPGKEPETLVFDVSAQQDVVEAQYKSMLRKYHRIDILVNSAGVAYKGPTHSMSNEMAYKIMETNFFGLMRLTNLFTQSALDADDHGKAASGSSNQRSIVNIGSLQSYISLPYTTVYAASKHALVAYADGLRAELAGKANVDVINVQPGYVNTNVIVNMLLADGTANGKNDRDHQTGFEPSYVAELVVRSIIDRDREVLVAVPFHRFFVWIRFFCPSFFFWFVGRKASAK